jgi:hypothetical protein
MHPGGTDRNRIVRQWALYAVTVLAVGDAADEHGIDPEPEAEPEHGSTVAPTSRDNLR